MEIILLGFAWILYFFIHSFLASNEVKLYVEKGFSGLFSYYRILYNFIATAGLIPLLYLSILLPNPYLFSPSWLSPVAYLLIFVGLMLLYLAFKAFDGAEFLGLKKEKKPELVLSGMYRFVRHPLYFATIILILGLFLLIPTQKMGLVLLISYVYILVGYRLEERKLVAVFGTTYTTYQKRVKALIPYLY
jgi:protein-S-isoprenylcysteine O-methyltransferase Ste14